MPEVLLLSRADLEKALEFRSVVAVLEEAFHAERRGEWDTPKRIAARTAPGTSRTRGPRDNCFTEYTRGGSL